MSKFWRNLGEYGGVAVAFEAFAGGGGASPYMPDQDSKLVGIRIIVGSAAAATLTEGVIVRITCAAWNPNMQEFVVSGTGIRTAVQGNAPPTFDFAVDQPMKSGVPITLEGRHLVATAVAGSVTVQAQLIK